MEAGLYTFTNLISGTYHVSFTLPSGYQWTTANSGSDTTDSDGVASGNVAVTADYVLNAGQSIPTVDQGVWQPATIGNSVWEDLDHDGQQDVNESGISGVVVTIQTPTGTVTTTTDASGQYTFTNLVAGTYTVTFSTPAGYQPTLSNIGSDTTDSDPVNGQTVVTITNGSTNTTTDAGFWRPATLGDYVWEDLNHDGQQNDGATGVSGVSVTLLNSSNQVISTTTTNISGLYTFTNLISGTYHVSFTLPSGYQWTTANSGSDTTDSDGVASGNVAVTADYVLNAGQSITTVDQGIWRPATIGNSVWEDLDHDGQQDVNEFGISGVVVTIQTPPEP